METPEVSTRQYPPTPELDRMLAVRDRSQEIGEFIEWLQSEHGASICRWEDGARNGYEGFFPLSGSINDLLAAYFGLDQKKMDAERDAVLKYVRSRGNT